MQILIVFIIFLLLVGYLEFRKKTALEGFLVADRKASAFEIAFSIVATCVGGAATIGVVSNMQKYGFAAVWWLLSGAIGLMILAIFIAKILRASKALTFAQIAEIFIDKRARLVSAVIICVAWCAILAAQFSASARILSTFDLNFNSSLFIGGAVIIVYTILGGQRAVIRSDVYQYAIVIAAFLAVLLWLNFNSPQVFENVNFTLKNDAFGYDKIGYYLLVIGTSYVIDPMLFSRILSAKDERAAILGSIFGAVGIAISSIMIAFIGFGAMSLAADGTSGENLLNVSLFNALPASLGSVLMLGLLAAIISSADTCLITASSIFAHDILRSEDLKIYRIATLGFGAIALLLASFGGEILNYLFAASNIFVSGVAAALFFAIIFRGKIDKDLVLCAMCLGGALGLAAAISGINAFAVVGIITACILCLAARLKFNAASSRLDPNCVCIPQTSECEKE